MIYVTFELLRKDLYFKLNEVPNKYQFMCVKLFSKSVVHFTNKHNTKKITQGK